MYVKEHAQESDARVKAEQERVREGRHERIYGGVRIVVSGDEVENEENRLCMHEDEWLRKEAGEEERRRKRKRVAGECSDKT
jgi:hypothetical protein